MTRSNAVKPAIFVLITLAIASPATAADDASEKDTPNEVQQLRQEVKRLRRQVRQLRKEVRGDQRETADRAKPDTPDKPAKPDTPATARPDRPDRPADTPAPSTKQDPATEPTRPRPAEPAEQDFLDPSRLTAGHDGSHFFIKSADDDFYLELAGHLQVRYVANQRDNADAAMPSADDDQEGFQLRRLKFKPEGYVTYGDRKINFDLSLAGDRDSEDTFFEDYTVSTRFFSFENVTIKGGRWKQPFARQNMRSSSRQLAVERSLVNELFNVDRSEGAMLSYAGEAVRLFGAVNNGADAEFSDFDNDRNDTDVAFTGRGEWLLMGEWDQVADDASSWQDEGPGAALGAAVHYEIGTTGSGDDPATPETEGTNDNFLLWTADATYEQAGLGLTAAAYGRHSDNELAADFDDYGLYAEGGYMIVPDTIEPFTRYELVLTDDDRTAVTDGDVSEETHVLTAGVNWYHAGHNSKLTLDIVHALDPIAPGLAGSDDPASTGLGLLNDAPGEDGQTAIRAQYQLKW